MAETDSNSNGNSSAAAVRSKGAFFRELGQTERTGRRFDGRTYDPYEPRLSGSAAFRTYEEMATDPTLGGVLLAIEMFIRNVRWWVEPAGSQPKYVKAAQFLEECRNDMSETWNDFIVEALSMMRHGFSFHEIILKYRRGHSDDPKTRSKYDDGKIGIRKLPIRSQDSVIRWEFQDDGDGIKGMWQNVDPLRGAGRSSTDANVMIPLDPKGLLFRTKPNRRQPEGHSILRNAYRPWYFKRRLEEVEGIGIERELAGLPVLTAPEGFDLFNDADPDMVRVRQEATEIIQKVRANEAEGMLLPGGWEFKLASTGGTRAIDVGKTVERYTRSATMSMLADFIVLGHESVGSFSLADVKTNMFAYALNGWLDAIAEVLNRYLVPRLFRLNQSFPQDKLPEFKHGDTETPDLNELAGYITSLTGSGVLIPGPELEEYVRSVAGLPPVPEERKKLASEAPVLAPQPPDPATAQQAAQQQPRDPTEPVEGRGGKPATARQQTAQTQNASTGAASAAGSQAGR